MNTLRQVGDFVGIPQGAAARFSQFTIGMRLAGDLVSSLSAVERTSLRAMILGLSKLHSVTLDAELVGANSGEDPFSPVIRLQPTNSSIIQTTITFAFAGKVLSEHDMFSKSGDFHPAALTPGSWLISVTRTGVGNTGFVELAKSFNVTVSARPQPPPPPKPPPPVKARLTLSITNQATTFFRITAVAWSIERQELNGTFTLVASPSGAAAVVEPPSNGEYHIHGVVSVDDLVKGENVVAEFRGNTTIHGLHTQLIVWTGQGISENCRLFTEPVTTFAGGVQVTSFNPVVAL